MKSRLIKHQRERQFQQADVTEELSPSSKHEFIDVESIVQREKHEKRLCERDGFLADPSKAVGVEVQRIVGTITATEYECRVKNMTYLNLCLNTNLVFKLKSLFGLGLKFGLRKPRAEMNVSKTITHLRHNIRQTYCFMNKMDDDDESREYIPSLHINSDWDPPPVNRDFET